MVVNAMPEPCFRDCGRRKWFLRDCVGAVWKGRPGVTYPALAAAAGAPFTTKITTKCVIYCGTSGIIPMSRRHHPHTTMHYDANSISATAH